jgi:hypothetical protein
MTKKNTLYKNLGIGILALSLVGVDLAASVMQGSASHAEAQSVQVNKKNNK